MGPQPVEGEPRTLADQLARVESGGLIRLAQLEPEVEYLFRHALVQDAAYWSLLREQRKSIHLSIGVAIESLYPDRLTELAPVLAHHFDEGADPARALHYYRLAGDSAAARYANDEAVMAYDHALALAEKHPIEAAELLHLYTQKGRAQELSGRYDDALATYDALTAAGKTLADPSLELASLISQATIFATYTTRADPAKGAALSEQALALAREVGDEPAQAKILWNLMLVNYATGAHAAGITYGEESLEIARRLGLREQVAYTLHDLGGALLGQGQIERAQEIRAEARQLWRELGNKAMLADNLVASSMPLVVLGEYMEAQAMVEEGLQISQSIGNAWGQSYANMGLSYINASLGRLGDALHNCRESVRLGEIAGFGYATIFSRCVQAMMVAYLGQPDEALALIEAANALTDKNLQPVVALPLIFEINVRLTLGDLAGVERLLASVQMVEEWDDPTPLLMLGVGRAALRLAQGRPEEAILASEAMVSSSVLPVETNIFIYEGKVVQARALLALGRAGEARALMEAVLADCERTGAHYFRWETLAALADAYDALGDAATAATKRDAAHAEIEFLIGTVGDARYEASFRARPDVAALLKG